MARNDGIDRTSARNQGLTEKAISRIEGHNERLNETYTNPDIVRERSPMNVHFKTPTASYAELFANMESSGEISTRGLKPDAEHYGEMVFDVNSAYFHNHGGYKYAKRFFEEAYRAAVEIVGDEKYILSAVMHADERNRRMSEALGYDVFHYHLHVVYIPVVEKQILWSKRCKDPKLRGTVKETIKQVSHSKKWKSDPALDENGKPMRNANGKIILKKSYSVLQDRFYDHMLAAGYTDIQRGERGSTEEHLTTVQFKTMREKERLAELEVQEKLLREETEKAESEKRQAEQEVITIQTRLDELTGSVKNAEAFAAKIGEPELLLPSPGIMESAKTYRQNTALPIVKKLIGLAINLYRRLTAERTKSEKLQTENNHLTILWKDLSREAADLKIKSGKFDRLCKMLETDEINRLLDDRKHRKEHTKETTIDQHF